MPAKLSFSFNSKYGAYCKFVVTLIFLSSAQKSSAQTLSIQKIHCSLNKDDAATIEKIAHYEADFYNAVFDTEKNDSLKINVHVFGRKEEFRQTPNGDNALHIFSDGYYLAKTGDVFVLKTDHVNSALLHEISHAILHQNMGNPPQWFDEGLATYFGSLVVEKNQIFYTPVIGRIERIREMNQKGILNLANYLNTSDKRWTGDETKVSDQYTIAYSIIYFLVKTNLNLAKHLAEELKSGQSAMTVLSQDFGGFEFFQSKYISFYKNEN